MSQMADVVFGYPKLKNRIESSRDPAKVREKILKNLKEIRAEYSEGTLKSFEKFLDTSLNKLYDGIHFSQNDLDIEGLIKDNCIVLVPNHQSHADYLAINYMFFKHFRMPLYVAGGNNLNIFPIGRLFRKSGCFFIRRSFQSDILYKLSLEGYLYYLLKMGRPIEFFFEGGRSRTGKLLPPRFGLFHMLLEAHEVIKKEDNRNLMFIPVSIAHEYVPEQKSLTRELGGKAKKKETTRQLFGLFKLFAYQFGNVHIHLGKPILAENNGVEDLKQKTHDVAFKCFREVGKNMRVTPSSLLSLILLDEPSGALKWTDILQRGTNIISYCKRYHVPITDSLDDDHFITTMERAMDIMIGNKKIQAIGQHQGPHVFYSIEPIARPEFLYFKNMILHHFLVPAILGQVWINLFNGTIADRAQLKQYILDLRKQLKFEFYLPTVKQFFFRALKIMSDALGRKVSSLDEMFQFSNQELYALASAVGVFNRSLSFLIEAYYITTLTILHNRDELPMKRDLLIKEIKNKFTEELRVGRVIKYSESFSMPIIQNALKHLVQLKIIEQENGAILLKSEDRLKELVSFYGSQLKDQMAFNIKGGA